MPKPEDVLSPDQLTIYNLFREGKTENEISLQLNKAPGIVAAQLTRIRNKGIIPKRKPRFIETGTVTPSLAAERRSVPSDRIDTPSGALKDFEQTQPPGPQVSAPVTNSQIADDLEKAGIAPADFQSLFRIVKEKVGKIPAATNEVMPMVLMGCTIQYVKLVGGRMAAHQLIEDVYSALRQFARERGESVPPDQGGETEPFPETDRERMELLERENQRLREALEKKQEPRPSSSYSSSYGQNY